MNYDVKFQNTAVEEILGFNDIQMNLHTPTLLFPNKMRSLHQLTGKKDQGWLSSLDAQVVSREDHLHN